MRNFIPKRNNLYKLPHNIYMQMLYVLRDYARIKSEASKKDSLSFIFEAISSTIHEMKHEYTKRTSTYGELDSYKAFFDYSYYSYMYARRTSDYGASKNAWNLYRSKMAYILACKLNII